MYRARGLWAALLGLLVLAWGTAVCAEDIAWAKSFDEGMKEAGDSNKPAMVDVYTDWCGWCKRLDKDVYTNADVAALAKDFVCIKLNPEKDKANGSKFKVEGFPTIIFTDAKGNEIHRVVGYKPAAAFLGEMKVAKEKAAKAAQ